MLLLLNEDVLFLLFVIVVFYLLCPFVCNDVVVREHCVLTIITMYDDTFKLVQIEMSNNDSSI